MKTLYTLILSLTLLLAACSKKDDPKPDDATYTINHTKTELMVAPPRTPEPVPGH